MYQYLMFMYLLLNQYCKWKFDRVYNTNFRLIVIINQFFNKVHDKMLLILTSELGQKELLVLR